MDAIAVWFSGLTKSGKTTAVLVYVMLFTMASAVVATQYHQTQLANAPFETATASPNAEETLAAVTEQRRFVMVFGEEMPFKTEVINDPTLPKEQSYVQTPGVKGKRDVTYEITYVNGQESERSVIKEKILEKPVNEVKIVGMLEPVTEPKPQALGVQDDKKSKPTDKKEAQEHYKIWVWDRKTRTAGTYCIAENEKKDYKFFKIEGPYENEDACLQSPNDWR